MSPRAGARRPPKLIHAGSPSCDEGQAARAAAGLFRIARIGQTGFTLLEVLIAVAIFSMISLGIFVSQKQTFRAAKIVQVEGDFYNGIRFAMELVNRDVMAMYTATVFLPPKPSPSPGPSGNPNNPQAPQPTPTQELEPINADDTSNQLSQFFMPAIDKSGVRPTRFQGTRDKMSFIAASHARIYKDSKECDFSQIRYELTRDDRKGAIANTFILTKTESVNVWDTKDNDKDPSIKRYRLLPGVKKIEFKYCYMKDNELKCVNDWDSDRDDYKNRLPGIIEVNIEVAGPESLSFTGVYRYKSEVPQDGLSATL